jgi:hypothetical protein
MDISEACVSQLAFSDPVVQNLSVLIGASGVNCFAIYKRPNVYVLNKRTKKFDVVANKERDTAESESIEEYILSVEELEFWTSFGIEISGKREIKIAIDEVADSSKDFGNLSSIWMRQIRRGSIRTHH